MTELTIISDKSNVAVHDKAHYLSIDELIEQVQVDVNNGLTSDEVYKRIELYGLNKLPVQAPISLLEMLWAQINSILIYILIVGAAVSFGFDHYIDRFCYLNCCWDW